MRGKLFAIGLGIAVLFPLSAHFLVYLFSPPPKWKDFGMDGPYYHYQLEQGTKEEKEAKVKDYDRRQEAYERAVDEHKTHVFYGVYPLGILAILLGARAHRRVLGAGFLFGGIFALADGCYSSWDIVPGWLSIASIFLALAIVCIAGLIVERQAAQEMAPPT